MDEIFLSFIKPIKVIVALTLILSIYKLNIKNKTHRLLIVILTLCFITEMINSILIIYSKPIVLSMTIGVIFHHFFWLILIYKNVTFKRVYAFLIFFFILFCFMNLYMGEGLEKFNYYTFITGAFIYIMTFVYESFYQLRKENFPFFLSNNYLLLSAPVIFFFGLSFMFGFKSKEVTSNIVFGGIKLYDIIIYFVNIVYYSLINIYIYREKKLANAR